MRSDPKSDAVFLNQRSKKPLSVCFVECFKPKSIMLNFSNLGPCMELDLKFEAMFEISDPKNPYDDVLFDIFPCEIPKLITRSSHL